MDPKLGEAETATVEPLISGTIYVAVFGVNLQNKGSLPMHVFHSRLWSRKDLISNPNSAAFYPMTLGKVTLPCRASISSFITRRKELQHHLTVVRKTRKIHGRARPRCKVLRNRELLPLLAVLNLLLCCVRLKVYDVLKVMFQFWSDKL